MAAIQESTPNSAERLIRGGLDLAAGAVLLTVLGVCVAYDGLEQAYEDSSLQSVVDRALVTVGKIGSTS